jgi:hypothetical protein
MASLSLAACGQRMALKIDSSKVREAKLVAMIDSFASSQHVDWRWVHALNEPPIHHTLAVDDALGARSVLLVGDVEDVWPSDGGIFVRLTPEFPPNPLPMLEAVRFVVLCPDTLRGRLRGLEAGGVFQGSTVAIAVTGAHARPLDSTPMTYNNETSDQDASPAVRTVVEGRCRGFIILPH